MFQRLRGWTVGSTSENIHTQYPLVQIRQQVGLRAKQILRQAVGVVTLNDLAQIWDV